MTMEKPKRKLQIRMLVMFVVFAFCLGALGVRLVFLQVIDGPKLQREAIEQQTRDNIVTSKRGTIFDRNRKVLAQSSSVETVTANPNEIRKAKKDAAKIAAELSVVLLEKLLGEEITPAAADTFTDCSDIYALKAYAACIVSGIGNKLFAPNAATNREQIACMLDSAIKYYEEKEGVSILRDTPELSGFTDIDKISSWALPSVSYLAGNGIMAGTSETELSPQAACTLEQSISFSLRTYKVVKLLDPNYSTIDHDLFNYVGYENYPFVPDLGKTFDLEGRALSQEELQRVVPSSDYQTPLEGYIYGPVSKEPAAFNLFTTCLKSFMFEQSFRLYYESDSTIMIPVPEQA